jgi:tartrate dehydrogenase/decarboxylase/D-malate dehydrogenase
MLAHLGLEEEAARIERAVEAASAQGVLTRDVGGSASTDEVTAAVVANL